MEPRAGQKWLWRSGHQVWVQRTMLQFNFKKYFTPSLAFLIICRHRQNTNLRTALWIVDRMFEDWIGYCGPRKHHYN
jgi:hypothetical protein